MVGFAAHVDRCGPQLLSCSQSVRHRRTLLLPAPPVHTLATADLDHHNPQLRESLIDWLNWLKTDIGFEGWVSGSLHRRPCFLVACPRAPAWHSGRRQQPPATVQCHAMPPRATLPSALACHRMPPPLHPAATAVRLRSGIRSRVLPRVSAALFDSQALHRICARGCMPQLGGRLSPARGSQRLWSSQALRTRGVHV